MTHSMYYKFFFCLFVIQFALADNYSNLIPASRRVDWSKAGVEGGIPRSIDLEINIGSLKTANTGVSDYDIFIMARDQARTFKQSYPGAYVSIYFPSGTYSFSSTISFAQQDSNLIIRGAGSSSTSLNFDISSGRGFNVGGPGGSTFTNLDVTQGFAKGNTIIKTVSAMTTVNNGDYIELVESNGSWIGNYDGGSGTPPSDVVGQIIRVKSISGDKLTLELYDELRIDYQTSLTPRIKKVEVIKNIGFEDFYISNQNTSNNGQDNIGFGYAVNCWVSGVESYNPSHAHVSIGTSSHIEVRGSWFHHAKSYGGGGRGYGVSIGDRSTNCLVENNIFSYLRHAMIISRGANGNVFGYNYSRDERSIAEWYWPDDMEGDISIHGHYPFANLFEGNMAMRAIADDWWGSNGPYNTFFRNIIYSGDIALENTNTANAVGCEFWNGEQGSVNNLGQIFYQGGDIDDKNRNHGSSDILDWYSVFDDCEGSTTLIHHYVATNNSVAYYRSFVNDVSYYRSARPSFITTGQYTWPPIGPKYNFDPSACSAYACSGKNPAFDRWSNTLKTISAGSLTYRYKIDLTSMQFPLEGGSASGGFYKINNIVANGVYGTTVTIEAFPPDNNYAFYQWSDGVTQNPRVLTLTANTTLYANVKRHLYSTSSFATANTNQRKIVQTQDGNYFMIYESQNRIWIVKSTDGVDWGKNEFEVSAGTPYDICKSPSIVAHENGNIVAVVWQGINATSGGFDGSNIYFRVYNNTTGTWGSREELPWFEPSSNGYEASPVVSGYGLDENGNSAMVIWREPSGLAVTTKHSDVWTNVAYIPNTNGNSLWPSITRRLSGTFAVCWQNNDAERIDYTEICYIGCGYNMSFLNAAQVSPSGWGANSRPSIAVNGDRTVIVTWQSFSNVIEGLSIHVREKPTSGGWSSTITSFSGSSSGSKPVIGTFLDLSSYYLLWEVDGSIYSTRGLGTTWTTPSIIASGASGGTNISAVNRTRTALRQIWKKSNNQIAVYNSGLQKTDNTEKFVSYRLNKHVITYLDSIPALREQGYKGMIAFEIAGLSQQSGSVNRVVESKNENKKHLRSEKISVASNTDVVKLAGAYYAKGLKIPEKSALNDISHLIKVQLKDAATNEVVKEIWDVPFSRLAQATSTDGEFRMMDIPLSGLNGREVYLDIVTADTSQPIFVNDYYILSKEDERLKKFFAENAVKAPTQYALHQNYPNPFNPSTTIRFDIIEPQNVILKVYNSIGQEIKTVVNDYYTEGSHEVIFDASSLSSGAYFYRIVAGKFTATKSFVLLK